jgi:hypothetical protein
LIAVAEELRENPAGVTMLLCIQNVRPATLFERVNVELGVFRPDGGWLPRVGTPALNGESPGAEAPSVEDFMGTYNYTSFPRQMTGENFDRFPEVARVGTKASEGELIDVRDERSVTMSELWRREVTVVEFGSVT